MALSNLAAGRLQLPALPAAPTFHHFTLLCPELQLHVFSFVLNWMMAEARGHTSHQREGYTNIRQLFYEGGVNPLLRTNNLVRGLTLTAWRLELCRWRGLKTQREERRREKTLCLIELLGSKELHLDGVRLLLTSNAKWGKIMGHLHQLSHNGNEEEGEVARHARLSLFERISAASQQIEIWIMTYATNLCIPSQCTCIRNHNGQPCGLLKLSASYHCPSLLNSNPFQACNCYRYRPCDCPRLRRCKTPQDFQSFWESQIEDARRLGVEGGDENASCALSREKVMVKLKWKKEGWSYRDVVKEVRRVAKEHIQMQLKRWESKLELRRRLGMNSSSDAPWISAQHCQDCTWHNRTE